MKAMKPIVHPLRFPFEHRGKTHSEIRFLRRAKASDLIAADRQPGEMGREASLLAAVSDFDFSQVGEMDALDFDEARTKAGSSFLLQSGAAATSTEPSSSSTPGPTGGSTSS